MIHQNQEDQKDEEAIQDLSDPTQKDGILWMMVNKSEDKKVLKRKGNQSTEHVSSVHSIYIVIII